MYLCKCAHAIYPVSLPQYYPSANELCSPPPPRSSFKANPALGQFVHYQRQLYRLYKSSKGDESCGIKATQVQLLEDIGFACRKKPGVLWMAQFNLLKTFEKKHGHVHVPMHYKDDKRLGHWVNVSRLASSLKLSFQTHYYHFLMAKSPY
jgi:hypothetical protein